MQFKNLLAPLRFVLSLFIASLLLAACGGENNVTPVENQNPNSDTRGVLGNGLSTGSNNSNSQTNEAFSLSVNLPQVADISTLVALQAAIEVNPGFIVTDFLWKQIAGPAVEINNPESLIASFVAPELESPADLQFQLTATSTSGVSASIYASISINPLESFIFATAQTAFESDGRIRVIFTLSRADSEVISFRYATRSMENDLAQSDVDYPSQTGTIEFLPGETELSLELIINSDSDLEGTEGFSLFFSDLSNGQFVQDQIQILMTDIVPNASLSYRLVRTDTDNQALEISYTLDQSSPLPLNITFHLGSETTDGLTLATDNFTIPPFQVTGTVLIPILDSDTGSSTGQRSLTLLLQSENTLIISEENREIVVVLDEPQINTAPSLATLENMTMFETQTLSIALSATDTDSSTLSLGGNALPSFVTLSDLGDGQGNLTLSPTIEDEGSYTIIITASDGLLESKVEFVLTVNQAHFAFELDLTPEHIILEARQSTTFDISLAHQSNLSATILLSVDNLPDGVVANLSHSSVTLLPDESTGITIDLENTLHRLSTFELNLNAMIQEDNSIMLSESAYISIRPTLVDVVVVEVTPSVVETDQLIAISATLNNSANTRQNVIAVAEVRDQTGDLIIELGSFPVTLHPSTELTQINTGTIDSSTLVDGFYNLHISLRTTDGNTIRGRSGDTPFFIGVPVSAAVSAMPIVVAPGSPLTSTHISVATQDLCTVDEEQETQFTFIELTPTDVGSTDSAKFSTLPTADPALFGFDSTDIRRVNFDTTPDGTAIPSGAILTDEYGSLGLLMNEIQVSSSVYGGPASPPNATLSAATQGIEMTFTFSEPVTGVGIINTSPDQDVIQFYSPTGDLLFSIQDQENLPKNYNVDRFVGALVSDNNLIGSMKLINNTGNTELDELIFQVDANRSHCLYETETKILIDLQLLGADQFAITYLGETFYDIGTTLDIPELVGIDLTVSAYGGDGFSLALPQGDETQYNLKEGEISFEFSEPVNIIFEGGGSLLPGELDSFGLSAYGSLTSSHLEAGLSVTDDAIENVTDTGVITNSNGNGLVWESSIPGTTWIHSVYNGNQGAAIYVTVANSDFSVDVTHLIPTGNYTVDSNTISPDADIITDSEISWSGTGISDLSLEGIVPEIYPGETRNISDGTDLTFEVGDTQSVSYSLTLPPAPVTVPHIIGILPDIGFASPQYAAAYTLTLSNPGDTSETYQLMSIGLSNFDVELANQVGIPAGESITVPMTVSKISVLSDMDYKEFTFSIMVTTGSGYTDFAEADLIISEETE